LLSKRSEVFLSMNPSPANRDCPPSDDLSASGFRHTGEHLLLALYDGGRLWFRSPFDHANDLGDRAEAFADDHRHAGDSLLLELNGRQIRLVRGGEIDWEALIGALDLPTRTMPGRDPEEVWISPDQADRIDQILSQARFVEDGQP
jgi:hypothetical protein